MECVCAADHFSIFFNITSLFPESANCSIVKLYISVPIVRWWNVTLTQSAVIVFVQASVATWRLAPASVRMCWCRTLPMISLWPSREPSSSSVSSPPTRFYTSAAGKKMQRQPARRCCICDRSGVGPELAVRPCRAVVEGLWLRFRGEQVEVCVRREQRRRVLQTLVWCTVTLVLALFIPDIGRVISLIGGLAACFIFVFPGNATGAVFDVKREPNVEVAL